MCETTILKLRNIYSEYAFMLTENRSRSSLQQMKQLLEDELNQ